MLTNNFYTLLKCCFAMGKYQTTPIPIRLKDGSSYSPSWDTYYGQAYCPFVIKTTDSKYISNHTACVSFGSGTRAPTRADYALEAPINMGSHNIAFARLPTSLDESGNLVLTINAQIIANAALTISEVGWFAEGSSSSAILMDRTVLETPLRLAKGEAGVVNYKITNASAFNF